MKNSQRDADKQIAIAARPTVPLSLIQVSQLVHGTFNSATDTLIAPFVKLHLESFSRSSSLRAIWDKSNWSNIDEKGLWRVFCGSAYQATQHDNELANFNEVENYREDARSSSQQDATVVPLPIMILPSSDPTNLFGIPCIVRIYSAPYWKTKFQINKRITDDSSVTSQSVAIVGGTAVQVLPPIYAATINVVDRVCLARIQPSSITSRNRLVFKYRHSLKDVTLGESITYHGEKQYVISHSHCNDDDILLCFEAETVRALVLRMKILLSRPILVGTTKDALCIWHEARRKNQQMHHTLEIFWNKSRKNDVIVNDNKIKVKKDFSMRQASNRSNNNCPEPVVDNFLHDGALIVHDPHHCTGKTTLVVRVAQLLRFQAVHRINGASLFAKYGASGADAALESLLHRIILAAGVKLGSNVRRSGDPKTMFGSLCVVLDHLETFVTPIMSGSSGTGDPASSTLNSIAAYLSKVVNSISKKIFPFPTKNALHTFKGNGGYVLPVKLCLVGIVTCNDDGGRKKSSRQSTVKTVLDVLGKNRYRLPAMSFKGRYNAFLRVFEKLDVILSKEALRYIENLAATVTRGITFHKVAAKLSHIIRCRAPNEVVRGSKKHFITILDLKTAFQALKENYPSNASNVSIQIIKDQILKNDNNNDIFSLVGGNFDAKRSLEDTLALDERKQQILAKFGLFPPTGILLYGPPGTGKTLMAKATAQILQSTNGRNGVFISLQASDIVRSEVGESEKLVVSAFETAQKNAPAVIFIDEFEALFAKRDNNEGQGASGSSRLVITLLQCMDDVTNWRNIEARIFGLDATLKFASAQRNRVVILGATNAPWMVDRAFLRTGRFDRVVYVGLPNLLDREAILKVHINRMKLCVREEHFESMLTNICKTMARDCDGFSGADLVALCRAAAVRCLNEGKDQTVSGMKENHFIEARRYDINVGSNCKELVTRLQGWRHY